MKRMAWKAIGWLLSPVAVVMLLAGCASGGGSSSGTDGAVGGGSSVTVTAQQCAAVADVAPRPQAKTVALVIDRTRAGLAFRLPPAVQAELDLAQSHGWNLAVVSVNGAGANPIVAPLMALDPSGGSESTDGDHARAAALECLPHELDSPSLAPTSSGSDVLSAIAAAGRQQPEEMLVMSDGVSNIGGLNVARIGFDADAAGVATALGRARQLPDLHAVRKLVWTDLGDTAALLPQPARVGLQALWANVLKSAGTTPVFSTRVQAAHGGSDPLAITPTSEFADPMPKLGGTVHKTSNSVCVTLPSSILFTPNSAVLSNTTPLRPVAAALTAHPSWAAVIVGHTADYGSRSGQIKLSRQRAAAAAAAIRSLGAPAGTSFTVHGVGSDQPAVPEWRGGIHDIAAAAHNRRIDVSYGTPAGLATATCH